MKQLLGLVAAMFLSLSVFTPQSALAAPATPGGTLTLLSASPQLSQVASFEYTLSGGVNECPNGGTNKCARIQVVCSQPISPTNPDGIVYGEAYPARHPFNILLGGGGSEWLSNGGLAHCTATLYYWDFHPSQTFMPLATLEFDAAG